MKKTQCTFLFILLFGGLLWSGDGLSAERLKPGNLDKHKRALVKKAEKEGALVYYTSMGLDYARSLTRGFEMKYSFVKANIFRSGHEKLLSRLSIEQKAGRYTADVVTVGEFETFHLKKRGLTTAYRSPEAASFSEGFKDPEGYWTDVYDNLIVIAYNTEKVKPEEVPHGYADLLHPRWRERMAIDTRDTRWFSNMLYLMGEKKGLKFMRELAKQNLHMRRGRTLITQLLLAGEFDLQITAYWYRAHTYMQSGAPIRWVAIEPVIMALHPIAVVANAPHPNTARLFIDYVLSKEGQDLFSRKGRVSARPGIKPEGFPARLRLHPSRLKLAAKLEENNRLFRSIFLQ